MKRRKFNTEREKQFIGMLVAMPLAERQKELLHCDLNSLAKAMTDYSNTQIEFFAEALPQHLRAEFAKTVKMHKGEIPFPTHKVYRHKKRKRYTSQALAAVVILLIIIFYVDWFMP